MYNKNLIKTISAGAIGNVLEWYDFALYGYLAPIIADLFFPSDNPTISLIKTFGVFAAGFFMRPLGSLIFGHIGDKFGRKQALALSILVMAIATTLIGLLPTYQQIGIWAAVLLTILRLFQGLSVGGEYTTSVSFLVEHAPPNRRGTIGSFGLFGAVLGILLGSAVGAVLTGFLDKEALYSYGWRIAFLVGIPLGILGFYIRRKIEETPDFTQIKQEQSISKFPLIETLKIAPKEFLKNVGLSTLQAVSFYVLFVYLTTYYSKILGIPFSKALAINTVSMIVLVVFIPVMAFLSDLVGRKKVIISSILPVAVFSYPLFLLISSGDISKILFAHICFAFLTSGFMGTVPTVLVEMFPTKIRNTAYSVGYNLSLALFGGTAPLVVTYLIKVTGDILAPAYYLIIASVIALIIAFTLRETAFESLKK
ncbi:MAG: MHS family MFS transporter [Aquificae bacterium]|nr:MHS family MFS transporter [Aquificota bacterium]